MSSSQIELCGVSRAYGPGNMALDSLDLTIHEGERLAVLGPSGSGKTTLLRLIAGLETPDTGTIRIGGQDTRGVPPHRRDVAMVFQNPALYPHLSVLENLAFGLKARGVDRGRAPNCAGEVGEMLGLGQLLDRRPEELSGGERQRVALGRAVAREPRVLLLDEPFSNLDDPLRAALRGELLALHRRFGSTLVHVTHDQGEALSIGERLAVLHRRPADAARFAEKIYDQPAHRFVATFVGSPGMNLIEVDVVRDETTLRISTPDGKNSIGFPARGSQRRPRLPLREPRRLELGVRPERVIVSGEERLILPIPGSTPGLSGHRPPARIPGELPLITLQIDGQILLSRSSPFRGCEKPACCRPLRTVACVVVRPRRPGRGWSCIASPPPTR